MRHWTITTLAVCGALALSGCDKLRNGMTGGDAEVERAIQSVNVIDETNMNDIMLTVADPNEAVAYFKRATGDNPDRIDLQRGLAKSLIRAKRPTEGATAWAKVGTMEGSTTDDQISLADAMVRAGEWDQAEAQLDRIPPTLESFDRYRLEAMMADKNEDWKRADSFYETAAGLTTTPAGVLNNWDYSKLTRGEYRDAEKLFVRAITYNEKLFTADCVEKLRFRA
ncbi:MAG: tetratricopeptide repeat protein [Rhodobacteraceae bacterium]|nr:tetratricopeptide repeat protein [Paracoccaceae bacterium]